MDTMSLHSILCSYGDVVELDYKFDKKAIDELKSIKDWLPSPNGKKAINLTGPIEDLGLDTPAEIKHQRNQPYNENLQNCPSIKDFFDRWTELARCRAATMNKGSFFRLHRDAFRLNDQFRIFIPLNKTSDDEWMFIYDGKIERFKEGVPYILNTRKTHGSFAMADGIYHILMSVFLNEKNIKQISKMLPNCKEH
tara:strand:- start:914 stop:1498 length:585 start_codon:yes stop_codon:yes gene_type:complete